MATTITGNTIDVGTNVIVTDSAGNVGIGTSSPTRKLTVYDTDAYLALQNPTTGSAAGDGFQLQLVGNDVYHANYEAGSQIFTTSGSEAMRINSAGIVTKPLQPAFLATKTTTSSNMAIDVNNLISYDSERFDIGSNFASSIFTAPVTGKYHLTANVRLDQVDTAATFYQLKIVTSNVTYSQIHSMKYTADPSYWSICFSIFADMDINDTALVYVKQTDGTAQTDIDGNPNYNNFSGYLVC